jgi:predicted secreted protein with PEFG-CTERM motif
MQVKNNKALFLTCVLILSTANTILSGNNSPSSLFLTRLAYAQSPDVGSDQDIGTGDNSTDLGPLPDDNSTNMATAPSDPYADLGTIPSDNSTDLSPTDNLTSTETTPSTMLPQNSTSGVATPEFGPIASAVLVLSLVSIIIISARTRLKFSRS